MLDQKGAADYVLKDRLGRLGSPCSRTRTGSGCRMKATGRAEIHASQRRFRALIEHSAHGMALFSPQAISLLESVEPPHPGLRPGGVCRPQALRPRASRRPPHRAKPGSDSLLKNAGGAVSTTQRVLHNDGSWRWTKWVGTNLLAESDVQAIVVNYRDIRNASGRMSGYARSQGRLSRARSWS